MKKCNTKIVFFFAILIQSLLHGQTFDAKSFVGLNASQMEGDNLSGFNKIGIQAGIGVVYPMYRKSLSIELLLNQKGSTSSFSISSGQERQSTNLNYLQIPILYAFEEWYDDESDYYRIAVEVGTYYARLFGASSSNAAFQGVTSEFRKNDFGGLIGVRYRFNYNWSIGARYDHSFTRLYTDPSSGLKGLLSYLVTLRTEYYF